MNKNRSLLLLLFAAACGDHPAERAEESAPLIAAGPVYLTEAKLVEAAPIIHRYAILEAGVQHIIGTAGTSAGADPVLHILDNLGNEVAFSDDAWDKNPILDFTPAETAEFQIVVRAKDAELSGTTDVWLDGVRIADSQVFGVVKTVLVWQPEQQIRATAQSREPSCNNPMLFLLDAAGHVVGFDDNDGPNLDALFVPATSGTGAAFAASTGGASCARPTLVSMELPLGFVAGPCVPQFDADCDGLSNWLELAANTSSNNADTDNDRIPDAFEVLGNDGFSYAAGRHKASEKTAATRRNIYVEVDSMQSATNSYQPYANLAGDAADIFRQDSDDEVELEVLVDDAIPFSAFLKFASCPANQDCANLDDLKAQYFASAKERVPFFHYAIFGKQRLNENDTTTNSSGLAEIDGNDFMVTLGNVFTNAEQLGTFIHELGHNIGLRHRGNDSNNGANSLVHASVMNYRYQFAGVPLAAGVRHTYSFGTLGCDDSCTSPKTSCAVYQVPNGLCSLNDIFINDTCDCDDLDEWANLDPIGNAGDWSEGLVVRGETLPESRRTRSRTHVLTSRPTEHVSDADFPNVPQTTLADRRRATYERMRAERERVIVLPDGRVLAE